MSIKQILNVWEHEFPHPEQAVMLALADCAHEDGTNIYPSVDLVAWKTGYKRRNVQLIMRRLENSGVLVKVKEATQHSTNVYEFDWSKATPKEPFDNSRGANITPLPRDAKIAPLDNSGVQSHDSGVQSHDSGVQSHDSGVHCGSPDPSKNRHLNRQEKQESACAREPISLPPPPGLENRSQTTATDLTIPEQPIAPEDYPSHSEVASFAVLKKRVARDSTRPLAFDDAKWSQSYNRYKPDGWMPVALLAPADIAAVREAIGRVGSESEALQRFVLALSWVRVGGKDLQWWRDKKLLFSTLLNPQKQHFLSFSEAAKVANVNPDAIADSGMSDRQIQSAGADMNPNSYTAIKARIRSRSKGLVS